MCDSNGDSRRDLSDAVFIFSWLFLGGNEPVSLEPLAGPSTLLNGDCNGDETRNISDGIYLLAWLFLGGPDPKEGVPGPTARADIGAEGGSLTSLDGTMTLTVPAGALDNTTEITITEVPADQVPDHLKAIEADRIFHRLDEMRGVDQHKLIPTPLGISAKYDGQHEYDATKNDLGGQDNISAKSNDGRQCSDCRRERYNKQSL
jgi:hypothetical protein